MVEQERIISLPKVEDERGNLTFLESLTDVPFSVQRVFWTYDVPGGQVRGGHAYKKSHEVIIALSGSFDVIVDGKDGPKKYSLNRSYLGLYVPALMWRHLENFSTNAVALTLASTRYDESDYLRSRPEYEKMRHES
jgi:dTDP-4-dehydrorhamnose 3,5-epimerase-like enzyme